MAWTAHWRGWSVAIIDREEANTASRVAAGLVTPITGSRAAASWRWDEFFPAANEFYLRVEKATNSTLWGVESALRVFRSPEERQLYQSKWFDSGPALGRSSIDAELDSEVKRIGLKSPHGICRFSPAARLQTVDYLDVSRRYYEQLGVFFEHDLQCEREIVFARGNAEFLVEIPALGLAGKKVMFCQGIAARENRFFNELPLHPARGDILTIESPQVHCDRVFHHDAWAVPIARHRFLVGATYDRSPFQASELVCEDKSNRFRTELMSRWESMVEGKFVSGEHTVLEQRWAVRPASYDRHPLIGPNDSTPNVFCLNGLGSKGTLMAPRLAEMLIEAMEGTAIDPSLLWSRRK